MCPACLASAAVMVAGVVSSGGLTALVVAILGTKDRKKLEGRNKSEREK
jgi:hypothetical protein